MLHEFPRGIRDPLLLGFDFLNRKGSAEGGSNMAVDVLKVDINRNAPIITGSLQHEIPKDLTRLRVFHLAGITNGSASMRQSVLSFHGSDGPNINRVVVPLDSENVNTLVHLAVSHLEHTVGGNSHEVDPVSGLLGGEPGGRAASGQVGDGGRDDETVPFNEEPEPMS